MRNARPDAAGRRVAARALFPESARASAYRTSRRALTLGGIAWELLGLWIVLRYGAAELLRRAFPTKWAASPGRPPTLQALVIAYFLFSLVVMLWNLPIGIGGRYIEQAFGFGTESVSRFAADRVTDLLVGMIVAPVLWGVMRLYVRKGAGWWKWCFVGSVPILFAAIVLVPVLVDPLYHRYTPLPQGQLRHGIMALAQRAHISNAAILMENTSLRTRHVNAYVTGLGPSARIVVNDTAIRELPEDQLLAMVGHEMGHYAEGHIWYGFLIGMLGAWIGWFVMGSIVPWAIRRGGARMRIHGMEDVAVIPLLYLVLTLFLLVQAPVESGVSRVFEHRADAYGLRLAGLYDASVRLFVGFAERDFSDPDPPRLLQFWFGDHPPLVERVMFALDEKAKASQSTARHGVANPPGPVHRKS